MNARVEKLQAAKEKVLRDKQKTENRLKELQKQIAVATRKERTKRLCTRGGMLERFLLEPELLKDEDVYSLLEFLFSFGGVQKELNARIEKRHHELTGDAESDSENAAPTNAQIVATNSVFIAENEQADGYDGS